MLALHYSVFHLETKHKHTQCFLLLNISGFWRFASILLQVFLINFSLNDHLTTNKNVRHAYIHAVRRTHREAHRNTVRKLKLIEWKRGKWSHNGNGSKAITEFLEWNVVRKRHSLHRQERLTLAIGTCFRCLNRTHWIKTKNHLLTTKRTVAFETTMTKYE